jgi:DNA replicative helicase MCM subunit Mcm2 (Cdc46/Mcm family)
LLASCKVDDHIGIAISALDIINFDSALAFNLVHYPSLLIPIFDEAILESQSVIYRQKKLTDSANMHVIKRNCHVRIHHIPPLFQLSKPTIGQIRSFEVDKMIQITGTVVRIGSIRMLHIYKEYECMNRKCGLRFRVCADPEQGYILPHPRCCPGRSSNRDMEGNVDVIKCTSSAVREIEGSGECIDYQEIKIQDQVCTI